MGFFFENVIFFLGLGYGGIMANGMASLMVGASGLKTSQTALNTTAHNLSNVNTTGYTRQQITFADSTYVNVFGTGNSTGKCGLGVDVDAISRIRNDFIDKSYRTENARLGYYESQYKAVEEVEDLFGEMQGVTYQKQITNLYNAINELTKNPTSTIARSSLIQNATAFIDRSEAIYAGLKDYQVTLNTDINNMVNKINNLGQKIYDLNKEIAKVESGSGERANDLRDTRDNALDELSGYIDFDYYENEHGEVIVTAENVPFVTSAQVTEMGTRQVDNSALLIPIWPGQDNDEFNLPLAVIVNGNSASASEIFAGAIQDYGKGTIIGTQTYGKGIVQTVKPLTDGSAIKFTIAKYFTPKGQDIHGKGVTPDMVVEYDTDADVDTQLDAAIKNVEAQIN